MLILPTPQLPANFYHFVPEGDIIHHLGSQEDEEITAIFNDKSLTPNVLFVPRNVFFPRRVLSHTDKFLLSVLLP